MPPRPRSQTLGAALSGSLATLWTGGAGPSHASVDSAFAVVGIDSRSIGNSSKQARIREALSGADDQTAVDLATELVALLRTEGFFENPGQEDLARIARLRSGLAAAGATLSGGGHLEWEIEAADGRPSRSEVERQPVGPEPSVSGVARQEASDPAREMERSSAGVSTAGQEPTSPSLGLLIECLRRLPEAARPLVGERRSTQTSLPVGDEYDVQDLVGMTIRLLYADTRAEEVTPSYGGPSGRMDFLVKAESAAVEVKVTRPGRGNKPIRDEIIIDQRTYSTHPHVRHMIAVVYDLADNFTNPAGFEDDLSGRTGDLQCTTLVVRWPQRRPVDGAGRPPARRRAQEREGEPQAERITPTLHCGIRELLADPPFKADAGAVPRLVLRAATGFRPVNLPDALPQAAFRTLPDQIPTEFLERWKPFYSQARNGGVGGTRDGRRDGEASSSRVAVAVREVSKRIGAEPEVASRVAVLLPGMMCSDVRFVVDLWLSERGPLPLDLALRSLRDAAVLAVDNLPRWFRAASSGRSLRDRVTLELHAEAVVAGAQPLGQLPLTGVLDLSALGEHEGRPPLVLSGASLLSGVDTAAIARSIEQALDSCAPNWGYFSVPDGLVAGILAANE